MLSAIRKKTARKSQTSFKTIILICTKYENIMKRERTEGALFYKEYRFLEFLRDFPSAPNDGTEISDTVCVADNVDAGGFFGKRSRDVTDG